jgi:hypothetical protein
MKRSFCYIRAVEHVTTLRGIPVKYETLWILSLYHFIRVNVYSYVNEIIVPGDGVVNIYFFNCE